MRVLIIGAGRIGMHLIRYLSTSEENQLTVIEKRQERCKEVSEISDATIINEDGSKAEILKKAEASQADLLLVATSDDRANLSITRQSKKDFGVPRIISVANRPSNKQRISQAGADIVICPVELALRDFENLLARDRATTLIYRPELDLRVAETTIPLNATLIGKKIHEIQMPEKCRVGLVCRDDSYVFPDNDLELKSGDKILLLGDAPSVARTVELLRSTETA
jgi:trk system potassium uptake protein TrkA